MRIYNVINIPKGLQEVECNCQEEYLSGYTAGHKAGEEDQKAKLSAITITTNGNYTRGDGYSAITVNVPQSGGSCNIENTKFVYLSAMTWWGGDFYSAYVDVHPDEGYDGLGMAEFYVETHATEAITDGENRQKAKLSAITITENGNYTRGDGYSAITVNVPSGSSINNQSKTFTFTRENIYYVYDGDEHAYYLEGNGIVQPDSGYTGLDQVTVNSQVNITDFYNEAFEKGERTQKNKLRSETFTQNGVYTRADGWSEVTVNVSGYTPQDMQNSWNSGHTSGVTDGEAAQKAKLASTAFTENGTYTRADGWSAVTVNVSGYTQQDLDNAFRSGYTSGSTDGYDSGWTDGYGSGWTDGYASGYTDGWADGYESGQTVDATAITLNVASAITGTGKASVTVEPSNARTNLTYASSDPTVATINSNGTIYVLSAGTVTITVTDTITQLTDSETISVTPAADVNTPLTVEAISAGTILWVADTAATPLTIEYQLNNGNWTSITATTGGTPINVTSGDVVKFRGDNSRYGAYGDDNKHHLIMQSGKYVVKGNIMSLVDSTNYATATALTNTYVFETFFWSSLGLVDASGLVLPATVLTDNCYGFMFFGCTNLVAAPSILPATTLAPECYRSMFRGCTSLTIAPELPATTLAASCYYEMFRGCTSLTTAPELPATTLADRCYVEMFRDCASLTTAPALPATALTYYCYNYMFYNCSGLTTAPDLPAPILTTSCYQGMFTYCRNLNYIKCLAISGIGTSTYSWVQGVAASGTFVKDPNATWTTGDNGIPDNWTIQDAQ